MWKTTNILSVKNLNKSVVLGGSFLLFTLLFLLTWASFRGFDFSDESYYHIGYLFGIEIDNSVIFFHRIYNSFFGFLHLSFVQNRLLGLFLTLFSSIFLAYVSALYFEIKEKAQLIIFTSLLGFLAHSIFPMSISYNLFSAIFSALLVGLTFLYLKYNHFISVFLIGFFTTLLIANKFTNLSFLFFLFPSILSLDYFDKKRKITFYLKSTLIALLGFLTATIFLFHSFYELNKSIEDFLYGLSLSTGHSLREMLDKFYIDLINLLILLKFLLPTLILVIYFKWKKNTSFYNKIILIVSTLNILVLLLLNNGFMGKTVIFNFFFYLILITVFITSITQKKQKHKKILYSFILIFVPFACSIGTNNSLFVQFTFYGNVFAIGLFLLFSTLNNYYFRYFLVSITLVVTFLNISYNKIYNPYRIDTNLVLQTEEIKNISYLKGLKVDVNTKKNIQHLLGLKKYNASRLFLPSKLLGTSLISETQPLLFTWIDNAGFHLIPKLIEQKKDLLSGNLLFVIPSKYSNPITHELFKIDKLNFKNEYRILDKFEFKKDSLLIYGKL